MISGSTLALAMLYSGGRAKGAVVESGNAANVCKLESLNAEARSDEQARTVDGSGVSRV
jgi:hypothetical protein